MANRSRARFRSGQGRRLTAQAIAIAALRTTGRGLISGRPTQNGFAFRDRAMTQPWVYPQDLEQPALAVIPVSAVPPGVLPWSLGANSVTNSSFASGQTGFIVATSAASTTNQPTYFSSVTGGARITNGSGGTSDVRIGLTSAITTVVGRTYRVTVNVLRPPTSITLRLGFNTVAGDVGTSGTLINTMTAGSNTVDWVATATSFAPVIRCSSTSMGAGDFYELASITVQEVIYDWSWLGANLVTNGDFSNGTTGWASSSGSPGTIANVNNECQYTKTVATGAGIVVSIATSTTVGKTYRLTASYRKGTTAADGFLFASNNSDGGSAHVSSPTTTGGTVSVVFSATASTTYVGVRANGMLVGDTYFTDNITFQEIPAYPLVAPTAGGVRPSGRYNLLQRTEEFGNAYWAKNRGSITSTTEADPLGGSRGCTYTADGTSGSKYVLNNSALTALGGASTFRVWVHAGTSSFFQIFWTGDATSYVNFNASTGAITAQAGTVLSPACVSAGGGWWLITVGNTSTAVTGAGVGIIATGADSRIFSNTLATTIKLFGADLRLSIYTGPAYPAYQRVGDGTGGVFDYDHVGFPVWCAAAASNAGLHTVGTLDLSATNSARLGCVTAKLSNDLSILAEMSSDSDANSGTLQMLARSVDTYRFRSRGTGSAANGIASASTLFPAPVINAITGIGNIPADVSQLRVNGALVGFDTSDQGAGNLGNYRYYAFGRNLDGTASLLYTGRLATWVPHIVDANSVGESQFADLIREDAAAVGLIY